MARLIIIAFSILISLSANTEEVEIASNKIFLETNIDLKLTISKPCLSHRKTSPCAADKAFKKSKSVTLSSNQLSGGKNPGAVKCEILGGTVVIGTTINKDEFTLCKFKDDSYVDCGSL